jgi:hypothetical protein
LHLVERTTVDIDEQEALGLLADVPFNALIDAGIIEFVRTRGGRFSVRANQFVGHARIGGGNNIAISEKSPGALAGMLPWASPGDLREISVDSNSTNSDALLSVLVERFVFAVSGYINQIRKAYLPHRLPMVSPRGRIDTQATIRLRARGRRNVVACVPLHLSTVLPANALIALGLLTLESWSGLAGVNSQCIIKARSFLPFFSEFNFHQLRRMGWQTRSREFDRELSSPFRSKELEAALAYGRPIVLHAMSAFGSTPVAAIPSSFFINLETLFEDAVLSCLKDCLGERTVQRPTEMTRLPLLEDSPDRYKASPDAVCSLPSGATVVADCKYKTLDGGPSHSDLYQILAHADAYSAKRAIMFFPGDIADRKTLGTSRGGVEVCVATIRCSQMREDIQQLASEMLLLEH